jgi:hypothetical protein
VPDWIYSEEAEILKINNMKHNLDIKSVIIGLMGGMLLIGALSFKAEDSQKDGRYQTFVAERGVVILDTKTGAYILNTDLSNTGWRKGDFANTHSVSKGNLK